MIIRNDPVICETLNPAGGYVNIRVSRRDPMDSQPVTLWIRNRGYRNDSIHLGRNRCSRFVDKGGGLRDKGHVLKLE